MVMTDVFSTFLVAVISLCLTSKVAGKGLKIAPAAIFAASAFYSFFGLLFLAFPWGLVFKEYTIYWLLILDGILLPAFVFWLGDKFLDGFEFKAKKYYSKAIGLFILSTFVGVAIVQLLPFIGLGLFGGSSYCMGRYSRPSWIYSYNDYYWYYHA